MSLVSISGAKTYIQLGLWKTQATSYNKDFSFLEFCPGLKELFNIY